MGCRDRGRKERCKASEDADWEAVPRHFLICGEKVKEASTGDFGERSGKDRAEEGIYGWR